MSYRIIPKEDRWAESFFIVGCGGTGSFVAEGMCRLLADSDARITLVDHDRVEPHNLLRQNFFKGEVGKFKSQALAERLSRLYGRQLRYSVLPFDEDLTKEPFGPEMRTEFIHGTIVGCVDNPAARKEIAKLVGGKLVSEVMWVDAGNGRQFGQVLVGNTAEPEGLRGAFDEAAGTVEHVPAPSLQDPYLVFPQVPPVEKPKDCAEEVIDDSQSPVINQAMATLVLNVVHQLLARTLTYIGVYLDLEKGSLRTVPADPETVSRMTGIPQKLLMYEPEACSRGIMLPPGVSRNGWIPDPIIVNNEEEGGEP
jgi:hypothetical protein